MSRSKHQFRPGVPELFETRIVPTVTPIAGIPFVPPGQVAPANGPAGVDATPYIVSGTAQNTISNTVSNTSGSDYWVTLAVYRAPGGGNGNTAMNSTGSENLASQKLIAVVQTQLVRAGQSVVFTLPDASVLDQTGPGINGNHLTGDDRFQCDEFAVLADPSDLTNPIVFAPDKPRLADIDGYFIADSGQLFQYEGSSPAAKHHK